jgi:Acetyltransferase (GNAT) domain
MAMTLSPEIRVLRTREQLNSLRDFWQSCHPCRDADFDFFLFFIDLNPEAQRPHVVVIYEAGIPTAILAGRLDVTRIPVRVGYLRFPIPTLRIFNFVYGGWLGDRSEKNAKLLIGSVLERLRAGEADAAMLHYADLTSPLVQCATSLPFKLCIDHLVEPQNHWVREGRVGSGLLAGLPANERYNQRRRAKMRATDFRDIKIETFQAPDQVDRLMRDAEAVASTSYQRGLGVGFADTPIIRGRLEFEAHNGWLQGHILYLDSKPVAFWITSVRNKVAVSDYLAFNPDYAKYAPGMYLMISAIEGLHDVDRIDFGGGDARYKELFANTLQREATIYIFAPTIKAIAVNALRTGARAAHQSAKRALPHLAAIKRRWRTRSANQGSSKEPSPPMAKP